MSHLSAEERAKKYATQLGLELTDFLGDGTDGNVWKTARNTAIKAFNYKKNYDMELACYQRLKERNVTKIMQLAVPRLVGHDAALQVIEMEIVSPPCLIDFGKAYLDHQPEHSAETWQDYNEEQREIWEDRYQEVQAVLWKLKELGIFYRDAKPRNIIFDPE
jgi:hypothetical protein